MKRPSKPIMCLARAATRRARVALVGKQGLGCFFSGLLKPISPSEHFEKRTPGGAHRLCVFCTTTPTLFFTATQQIVPHCPSAIWKSDPRQCTTAVPLSGAAPTPGERLSFGSVVDYEGIGLSNVQQVSKLSRYRARLTCHLAGPFAFCFLGR